MLFKKLEKIVDEYCSTALDSLVVLILIPLVITFFPFWIIGMIGHKIAEVLNVENN